MSRTLVFFESVEPATGAELFESDGTAAGTVLVQDIDPGPDGSDPTNITAIGDGGVVFTADDGGTSAELYVTNGTANGTVLLDDDFIGIPEYEHVGTVYDSTLTDFTPLGDGKVLFTGATRTDSIGLWITDGTFAGTASLMDFALPYPAVALSNITALGNGTAVFDVGSSAALPGLWATDGTSAGTIRVSSVAATPGTVVDGKVITVAPDRGGGYLLGVTDGTIAGTTTLHDFVAQTSNGGVGDFTPVGNGEVLFEASDGLGGRELWVTDGTASGTMKLEQGPAVTTADPSGFDPEGFTRLSPGKVVFDASDGGSGTELWVSDGTAAGTVPLIDDVPGISFSTPFDAGKALFWAYSETTATTTVWATDGTAAGTTILENFSGANGYPPFVYTAALPDGKVLFDVPTEDPAWTSGFPMARRSERV